MATLDRARDELGEPPIYRGCACYIGLICPHADRPLMAHRCMTPGKFSNIVWCRYVRTSLTSLVELDLETIRRMATGMK